MKKVLTNIQSGQFAKEWIAEHKAGRPNFTRLMEQDAAHQIEQVGRELRAMARIAQSSWRRRRATSSSLSFWPTVMWPSSPRNALPNRVPKNSSSAWRSSVEMDRLATWRVSAHPRLRPHRPHGQGEECPACETQRRSSPRVGERSRAPEGHASNRLILKQLVDRSGRSR